MADEPMSVGNWILGALPEEEHARLAPQLHPVETPLGFVFFEPEQTMQHCFFPERGIASMTTLMQNGEGAEVGLFSQEALVGLQALLEGRAMQVRCMAQTPGRALRVPAQALRRAFLDGGVLQEKLLATLHFQTVQFVQVAACNRLHTVEERLARWLLMVEDRLESPVLPLTHEFLASMLGANRSTVTLTAGMLARAGLIEYRRGQVRVLDRKNLESAACECYGVLRRHFDALRP